MRELPLQYKIKGEGKKKPQNGVYEITYWLLLLCALFFFTVLFTQVVGGQAVVHGGSMEPQLTEGDRLIYWRLFYEPKRGDVVMCHTGKGLESELVKRVIGLPGDVIDIDNETGTVYVNNKALTEPYCKGKTYVSGDVTYPITVPKGQYFVLGDNREESIDSRYSGIGTIEADKIDGHIVARIYPFSNIKLIE